MSANANQNSLRPHPRAAVSVLRFWFDETKPIQWYRRDPVFDQKCGDRFGALHELAAAGQLAAWQSTPRSALALIIVLDQFSRNIHRDTPRAFAQDRLARTIATDAINKRFDRLFGAKERAFFYMPFMHSEMINDQDKCVRLFVAGMATTGNVRHALQHRDIVQRFGRFPHRNDILGRSSSPAEIQFLKRGGFNP